MQQLALLLLPMLLLLLPLLLLVSPPLAPPPHVPRALSGYYAQWWGSVSR
jgi:hypothetical protein